MSATSAALHHGLERASGQGRASGQRSSASRTAPRAVLLLLTPFGRRDGASQLSYGYGCPQRVRPYIMALNGLLGKVGPPANAPAPWLQMPRRSGPGPPPGGAGGAGCEIADALDDGVGDLGAEGGVLETGFFFGVGDEGHLHQHSGHGGTPEDDEGGLLHAPLLDARQAVQLGLDGHGQALGVLQKGLLGQILQDAGHHAFLGRRRPGLGVLQGDDLRAIPLPQAQEVHLGAPGGLGSSGVQVEADEEVGSLGIGGPGPVPQGDEGVPFPGGQGFEPGGLQAHSHGPAQLQGGGLLLEPPGTPGTAVVPAMARVHHHPEARRRDGFGNLGPRQ